MCNSHLSTPAFVSRYPPSNPFLLILTNFLTFIFCSSLEMSHKDPQMLCRTVQYLSLAASIRVGDWKFLVPSLTLTYVFSLWQMSVHCGLSCGYSSPAPPYLISFFSLSGGKWILLLLPISCVRSGQNGQETRFVTGEGHRLLILLHLYYHRHCVIRWDKCLKYSPCHVIMSASIAHKSLSFAHNKMSYRKYIVF